MLGHSRCLSGCLNGGGSVIDGVSVDGLREAFDNPSISPSKCANKTDTESVSSDGSSSDVEVFLDLPPVNRERLLIPPLSFSIVEKGVYRSGYPNRRNFGFLRKLGIRTIICLAVVESDSQGLQISGDNDRFVADYGIRRTIMPIESQKEPFTTTSVGMIEAALKEILDVRNHPVLVHCDKGKYQTGTVVGCLRKLQGWALSSVFDEYARFCKIKSTRILDHQLMEFFHMNFTDEETNNLPSWMWLHK